jgi:Dolichyl-phosphate-mannose-protein mannosyltransferase
LATTAPDDFQKTTTRDELKPALLLAGLFALVTLALHICASLYGSRLGYGFFRDELYFLVCGHHLDWGYVDQPPLVALQARVAEAVFGLTPTGIRILSFAAGAVKVGLTGMLAWQLGGRRWAQALAMTAALAAPVFLVADNYLSMNSWEPCFWMGCMFVVLRIADGSWSERWWLLFGALAGLGLENKNSMVFFLVALLAGIAISPQRKMLWSRWVGSAVLVTVLVALPNFIWQWQRHWPTYELLNNIAHSDKNTKLPPLGFLRQQVSTMLIFNAPLWIAGVVWLAIAKRAKAWRFAAVTYLVFLAMMMAMHAKDYYLAPIYPVLLAAGAVWVAGLTRRSWTAMAYATVLAAALILITIPIGLTVLAPEKYNVWAAHVGANVTRSEKYSSPLPQFLSDRFGWEEMAQGFAARYNALPPEERAKTGIFCGNYGEASAVNVFGPKLGLPVAISGHQNYFYWGWHGYTGEEMLTVGDDRNRYLESYEEVIDLGAFDAPWIMDHEHHHYFLLKHRKKSYESEWAEFKYWL